MLWLAKYYERITAPTALFSLFGIFVLFACLPKHPDVWDLSWILLSLAGAFVARSFIFSYLHISSYEGMHFRYLSPLQMIALTFCGLYWASLIDLALRWNTRRTAKAKERYGA